MEHMVIKSSRWLMRLNGFIGQPQQYEWVTAAGWLVIIMSVVSSCHQSGFTPSSKSEVEVPSGRVDSKEPELADDPQERSESELETTAGEVQDDATDFGDEAEVAAAPETQVEDSSVEGGVIVGEANEVVIALAPEIQVEDSSVEGEMAAETEAEEVEVIEEIIIELPEVEVAEEPPSLPEVEEVAPSSVITVLLSKPKPKPLPVEKPPPVRVVEMLPPTQTAPEPAPDPEFMYQKIVVPLAQPSLLVDFLLLVDNSHSMRDEIIQVQKKLSGFLKDLARVSHLKVGLMTAFDENGTFHHDNEPYILFSLNVPKSVVHINHRVRSWNSLLLASMFYNDEAQMARDLGISGADFFRPSSLKIFVVVSDDNANDMNADEFYQSLMSGGADPTEFRFYGFVGMPRVTGLAGGECQIAESGTEYYRLVMNYFKGALFDICRQDWQGYFDKILEGVVSEHTSYQFTLDYEPEWIYRIMVNGRVIDPSLVQLEGQTLKLGAKFFEGLELSQDPEVNIIFKSP